MSNPYDNWIGGDGDPANPDNYYVDIPTRDEHGRIVGDPGPLDKPYLGVDTSDPHVPSTAFGCLINLVLAILVGLLILFIVAMLIQAAWIVL